MQTFNELLLPDQTLFAINTNGDICKLAISGICERTQLGRKAGPICGYYVLVYFLDESDSTRDDQPFLLESYRFRNQYALPNS